MMISPECFYEMELKDKGADEIRRKIRGLKRQIASLKRTMEYPNYNNAPAAFPRDDTKIWCYRQYIERAVAALEQLGESYDLTAAERRDEEFNRNIPSICKISFSIEGFFVGRTSATVKIDEKISVETENTFIMPEDLSNIDDEIEKEEFLECIEQLHIGEWRRRYSTERFGIYVLDGVSWKLRIEFNNGKRPFISEGCNAFPYNFDSFIECLGLDLSPYFK